MVNVITELEQRNKQLLKEIEQLKTPLQFKWLNNEEIRAWIATVLSESCYTDNPEVEVVDAIMEKFIVMEKLGLIFVGCFLLRRLIEE